MRERFPISGQSDLQKRELVINSLTKIFREWVYETCIKNGVQEEIAKTVGGTLFTSGSYRLGIHEPGADIDVICVAPSHVTIEDFFDTLAKKMKHHPLVKEFTCAPDAAVPIMAFIFDEVEIDLLLAILPKPQIPPISADDRTCLDTDDDNILRGVDDTTARTLNGPRTTNMLVKLVPNYKSFLDCVRCVRAWAKLRGLYSNKMGYLGGVNYNILCAFVCQLYPKASPFGLLCRFFLILSQWDWPNPIQLCHPYVAPDQSLEVWDASTSGRDCMPILTPAYPSMNSSYSVNRSTLEVMKSEWLRGKDLMQAMQVQLANQSPTTENWDKLFEKSNFFIDYSYYLQVNVSAGTEDEQLAWSGWCESRMRHLVMALGRLPLSRVHIWPKPFPGKTSPESPHACAFYIAFEIDKNRMHGKTLNLQVEVDNFRTNRLYTFTDRTDSMNASVKAFPSWKKMWEDEVTEKCFEQWGGKETGKEAWKALKRAKKAEKEKRVAEAAQVAAKKLEEMKAKEASAFGGAEDQVEEGGGAAEEQEVKGEVFKEEGAAVKDEASEAGSALVSSNSSNTSTVGHVKTEGGSTPAGGSSAVKSEALVTTDGANGDISTPTVGISPANATANEPKTAAAKAARPTDSLELEAVDNAAGARARPKKRMKISFAQ
jgi:poly(A) polymerase